MISTSRPALALLVRLRTVSTSQLAFEQEQEGYTYPVSSVLHERKTSFAGISRTTGFKKRGQLFAAVIHCKTNQQGSAKHAILDPTP